MRFTLVGIAVGLLVGLTTGCRTPTPGYCDENTPCTDPATPFCDLNGEYPASEGIGRTCIPYPVDGGVNIDAPIADDTDAGDAMGPDAQTNGAISVTKDGTGTGLVVSTPGGINCGSTCSADFPLGDTVTLTATADQSSDFTGWSGGSCSGTSTCDAMAGDSVTATFDLKKEDLTVSLGGDGTGSITATGINCGTDCSETYDYGTMVMLTATASGASSFGGWSGDGCSGTTPTCTVTMDQARNIGAAFDLNSFSLSVALSGTGGGSVTSNSGAISCPGTCSDSYTAGTMVTLTAAPDGTSNFTGWTGDCSGTGTCTVTMSAAHSVSATFTRITYALNVNKTGSGSGLVTSNPTGINCGSDCSQSYTKGTSVVLTQSADPGATFIGWSGGGCSGAGTTCTVAMSQARTVTAEFCAPVDDGISCTTDSCDATGSTVHTPINAACQDGLYCNGQEVCDTTVGCVDGPAPNLSDGIACTVDSCDEANDKAVHTPSNALCDNGKFCDGQETCSATMGCLTGTAPSLSDGVACTDDSCDETNDKIVHTANDANCDNGQFCDGAEYCDPTNDCQNGPAPTLSDGVGCTDDSCDETNDKVVHTANDANCADGNYCNGDETCDPLNDCQQGSSVTCPANNKCVVNSTCDESQDTCVGTDVQHGYTWDMPNYASGSGSLICSDTATEYTQANGCDAGVAWLYQCNVNSSGGLYATVRPSSLAFGCFVSTGSTVTTVGCSTITASGTVREFKCCY